MNEIPIEDYTLREAQERFKHSCKTCVFMSYYHGLKCSEGHRVKDILIINTSGYGHRITCVRKKGGCEDYEFNWG